MAILAGWGRIETPADPASPNGGNTGYRSGGNYTYRKLLHLEKAELARRHVLKLEGVYCRAMVYVNEQPAGSEANGYTGFYVDLTPWLHAGDNEIRVQVKNADMTNSRWYSGSGIYRDVYLLSSDMVYIEPDSVQVGCTPHRDQGGEPQPRRERAAPGKPHPGSEGQRGRRGGKPLLPQSRGKTDAAPPDRDPQARTLVGRDACPLPRGEPPHRGRGDAGHGAGPLRHPHPLAGRRPGPAPQRQERQAPGRLHPSRQRHPGSGHL